MNNTFSAPKEWRADATRKETFEHFGYEYRCLQDNVVYDAAALPSAWEDA